MFQSEPGYKALRTCRAGAVNLRQRRAWYADADSEGSAETDTTQDKGGQSTGAGLSQEDVNRLIGKTRKEARETGISEFLKELGFEKPDDLKALVTAAKARDDAEKSELEKAQQRIADLEKKAAEAEIKATKAAQQALEKERNTAILIALKDAHAEKPQSVLNLLLVEHASDVAAIMAEDGTLDNKKIGALADKAKKEYAGMFQSGNPGSPSPAGGKTPQPDTRSILNNLPKVRL